MSVVTIGSMPHDALIRAVSGLITVPMLPTDEGPNVAQVNQAMGVAQ